MTEEITDERLAEIREPFSGNAIECGHPKFAMKSTTSDATWIVGCGATRTITIADLRALLARLERVERENFEHQAARDYSAGILQSVVQRLQDRCELVPTPKEPGTQ